MSAHPAILDALHRPFQSLVGPALVDRATLLANHVIASEPAAVAKLRPHAGKCLRLQVDAWPTLLPAPPLLVFAVTPAGLLEWQAAGQAEWIEPVDLVMRVDASQASRLASQVLAGERPPVVIDGDAALAADVGWLVENLRWDIAADLERFLPAALVQQLVQLARAMRAGLSGRLATWRGPR